MIDAFFDRGPHVGLGHQRRMQALATALGDLGRETTLTPLENGHVEGPLRGEVVVVDSYSLRADDERVCSGTTVAVDDLGRDLAVDLVVDAAPDPGPDRRAARAGRTLRGLQYALIDPGLRDVRPVAMSAHVRSVLVATGGADREAMGARVAADLRRALPGIRIRLVVGRWSAETVPEGVEPLRGLDGLADELAAADLVVTASGVTLLEALVLGRPAVAFVTAENQRRMLDGLARSGAVVRSDAHGAAAAAALLASDVERRAALARRATALVDGRGAERVARAITELAGPESPGPEPPGR